MMSLKPQTVENPHPQMSGKDLNVTQLKYDQAIM